MLLLLFCCDFFVCLFLGLGFFWVLGFFGGFFLSEVWGVFFPIITFWDWLVWMFVCWELLMTLLVCIRLWVLSAEINLAFIFSSQSLKFCSINTFLKFTSLRIQYDRFAPGGKACSLPSPRSLKLQVFNFPLFRIKWYVKYVLPWMQNREPIDPPLYQVDFKQNI